MWWCVRIWHMQPTEAKNYSQIHIQIQSQSRHQSWSETFVGFGFVDFHARHWNRCDFDNEMKIARLRIKNVWLLWKILTFIFQVSFVTPLSIRAAAFCRRFRCYCCFFTSSSSLAWFWDFFFVFFFGKKSLAFRNPFRVSEKEWIWLYSSMTRCVYHSRVICKVCKAH